MEECDAVNTGAVGELVTKFSSIQISQEDQPHLKTFLTCINEHCLHLHSINQMGPAENGTPPSYENDFFIFAFRKSGDQAECRYSEYWKYNKYYSQTSKHLKRDYERFNRPDWSLAMQTLALCAANFLKCAVSITYSKVPHTDYGDAAVDEQNADGEASNEPRECCVLYAFPDDVTMVGGVLAFVPTLAILEKIEPQGVPAHNFNLHKQLKLLSSFRGVKLLYTKSRETRDFPLFHAASKWFKRKDVTDFDPRGAELIAKGSDATTNWNRASVTGIDAQGVLNLRYLAVMKRLYYAVPPYDDNPELKKNPLMHIFYELDILSSRQKYNVHNGDMLRKVFDNPALYLRHILQFIYDRFDDFRQLDGFWNHVRAYLGEPEEDLQRWSEKSIRDAYLSLLFRNLDTTSSTTEIKIAWPVLYAASIYFNQQIRVFFFDLGQLETNAKEYLPTLNSLPCMIADGTQPLARHAAQINIEDDAEGARVWDLVAFERAGKVVDLQFQHVNAYDPMTLYVNGMNHAEDFGLDEYREAVFKKINAPSSSASAGNAGKRQRTTEDGVGNERWSWYNGENSTTYHKTINGYCTFFSNQLQKYKIRKEFPEATNRDIGRMIFRAIEWKKLRYLMPEHYGVTTVQQWVQWYKDRVIEVVGNGDATSQRVQMYMFSPSSVKLLRWIIREGEHANKATTTYLQDLYSNRTPSYLARYQVPPELHPEDDTGDNLIDDEVILPSFVPDADDLEEDYPDPD